MQTILFAMPGPTELLLILGILLLVFGASKLPGLARSMGSSITQFKKGLKDDPELLEGKDGQSPGAESPTSKEEK